MKMNHYRLSEIEIGMTASFPVTITETMLLEFRHISGDENSLHTDAGFATARGYPDRVVYGMLTASFYSTLAGVYLPGENCLLWEVDSKFTAPVFVGDQLEVSGVVTEVNERYGFIRVKAKIRNQRNQVVSRAVITAGVNNGT